MAQKIPDFDDLPEVKGMPKGRISIMSGADNDSH